MQTIINSLLFLRRWAQALGPYLLLELLLPGGTLLALMLFLYRNGKLGVGAEGRAESGPIPDHVDFGHRQTTIEYRSILRRADFFVIANHPSLKIDICGGPYGEH